MIVFLICVPYYINFCYIDINWWDYESQQNVFFYTFFDVQEDPLFASLDRIHILWVLTMSPSSNTKLYVITLKENKTKPNWPIEPQSNVFISDLLYLKPQTSWEELT